MTPTQRSLKYLRGLGYTVEIVEKFNHFSKTRQDLFGIFDLLAIRENEITGVQVTSRGNVSARVKKITEHENLPVIRKAGMRVIVHGWGKLKAGWSCKEVDLS